ncbi:DNA-3-methyladenine glycosylase [Aspergillus arachidicola]|uniref:DNA-3-methyladenine glycosylase n=1 Tax=Aspergillus arachidicola TaxID=656916 RepID=A0A2G7FWC8_9EURO|nr:DNA-3-methyladenine glycosylase [Aspergillus arachidicola]
MALRRSARLSAVTNSVQPTIQAKKTSRAQQTSGVTKARKTPAKGKKTVGLTLERTLENPAPSKTAKADTAKQEKPNNIFDPLPTDRSISRLRSTPPPLDRPVEPHRTNATLLTPHGSSLVATRPVLRMPRLAKPADHVQQPRPQHPCPLFSPEGLAEEVDPFRSLVVSIIGQQVSGAAAKSIKNKFVALFNSEDSGDNAPEASRFPKPEEIIKCDIATLRTAGLSQRKAEYIQGLSQKFASGELSAQMLLNASDEELLEKLTAVRGLGKWSVEMFACFALKRIDVFSTGDLGVQRGCAAFMGKDVSKLKAKGGGKFKYMAEKDMLELAAKFAPYRSLFMWYMWRVEDVDIAVLTA